MKDFLKANWRTTLMGILTGAALGYAGYTTCNPELILAGVAAFGQGIATKDATKEAPVPPKP